MSISRLGLVGRVVLALLAVFAVGALTASAAMAEENKGPLWIVGSPAKPLAAGETRAVVSKTEEEPVLVSKIANIVCEKATNTGFLLGGSPGTDFSKITFVVCHVAGKKNCTATGTTPAGLAEGEIVVEALTKLAYAKGSRTSAVDVFAPEAESNEFVAFLLKNKPGQTTELCGVLEKNLTVKVKATGTEIKIKNEARKVGQIAEVGDAVGGSFSLTLSGETSEVGLLMFLEPPVTEAEIFNSETEKYQTITAKLEAGALGEVFEKAAAQIETSPKEPFGWDS